MAVALALLTAAVYGTGDFLGGLSARRLPALVVVGLSQLIGLAVAVVLALPLGGTVTAADVAWSSAAGMAGAVGLTVFYRALAGGAMTVVAPVTAVCAAAVPVVAGLAAGDVVGVPALAGVALALPAVGLVAAERGGGRARLGPGPLLAALVAGLAFGAFFVLLHRASPGSGLWPVVVARAASAALVGVALAVLRLRRGGAAAVPYRLAGATLALVAATGIADMTANVLYLLAVRQGQLSVVGLLSSLYPVSTVILATALLRERLSRVQLAGVGGCAVAVTLIAWG